MAVLEKVCVEWDPPQGKLGSRVGLQNVALLPSCSILTAPPGTTACASPYRDEKGETFTPDNSI